jgi:hypothetical protein
MKPSSHLPSTRYRQSRRSIQLSILAAVSLLLALPNGALTAPALRVVTSQGPTPNLLRNGGFEQVNGRTLSDWSGAPQGFRVVDAEGRAGSRALACESAAASDWSGASQTITLNRTEATPLIVRGWSRAGDVSGGADSGYALYVDLLYADGTPLWGQTGNFRCGTHDWERREIVIVPDKPVKSLTVHCLLRGHTGRAWFDEVSVEEAKVEGGSVLFQGVPVAVADGNPRPDGERDLGSVLGNVAKSGVFLARDVATNSDVFRFEHGSIAELGLSLVPTFAIHSNHVEVRGHLANTTGQDRAVTLVFALPIDATGWQWGDDLHRSRVIRGDGEFVSPVAVRCGATGTLSLYPMAAIWSERAGLALALDLGQPAVCRVGYHAGLKWLFIAYDFGLVQDAERFPGSADFRLVLFRFDPRWGFRAAWQRYMEIFPEFFVVRAREQGLWMPFTDVSRVEGWEDFGFKFHEGNNNVPWDDAHGILSFRYTEPMTWWMRMRKGVPRTMPEALRARDELGTGNDPNTRDMARVSELAAMQDETGQPSLLFRDEPWCDGAVWSLNPNPQLAPAGVGAARRGGPLTNAATVHWSDSIKEALYGPQAKGRLDGEYLDSLEGYVTAELNFRREHFRDTTMPLTFSTDTHQPALFKGLAVFEFTRWIADDVHGLGRLMFANGVPYRFAFLCPWLDVLGTETDWLQAGQYRPASIQQMDLWRTLSGAKPYLLLMNTDYDQFTPDRVEKYFQRALFYGMWPGFFSHNAADNPYWQNPKWYDRDRPLFRKYIPVIRRVAEAGWQPVTEATSDNERLLVERFGPDAGGHVWLTLHNDSEQPQTGLVSLVPMALRLPKPCRAVESLAGRRFDWPDDGWRISMNPQETKVVELGD